MVSGKKRKRYTYPDFRKSIKGAMIDGNSVDLSSHFKFRGLSNLSEVNKFYKKCWMMV